MRVNVLLLPRLMTFRNLWRHRDEMKQFWLRNLLLSMMTAVIMYGIYLGNFWILKKMDTQLDYAYFHPSVILGLYLAMLMVVLVVTNTASATGALFLGLDLDGIISSPISAFRFFLGKFLEISFSSSWMTSIFLLPLILSFGVYFSGGLEFYAISLLALLPFFVIPTSLAILIAFFVALFLPPNWRREIIFVLLGALLFGVYAFAKMLAYGVDDGHPIDTRDFFRLVSLLSVANTTWSPAYWVSSVIGEFVSHRGAPLHWYLAVLYGLSLFLFSLDFLLFRFFYFRSFSRAALHSQSVQIDSKRSQERFESLFSFLPVETRALAVKECKTSSRDAVQALQILFICVISALYLYVLSFEGLFQKIIPIEQKGWWRAMLITSNLCVEAFVITAIANRLVFPSISREGRAYWGLQIAPLSLEKLLRIKFFVWLGFLLLFTSAVFGTAALLLTHSPLVVLFKILLNAATAVGVVGLAIGMGAHFANFEWDHPAQLIMGFGNMVYMVVAVLLIGINLLGGGSLLFLVFAYGNGDVMGRVGLFIFITFALALAFLVNSAVAYFSILYGARSLESRK